MDRSDHESRSRTVKGSREVQLVLDHLVEAQRGGKLCLVLGAGASADYGLPGWKALTDQLAERCGVGSKESGGKDFSLLYDHLSQARRLEKDVSAVLHRVDSGGYGFGVNRKKVKLTAANEDEGPLRRLARLACLIAKSDPERDFHVVTYNMDTLLEQQIAIRGARATSMVGYRSGSRRALSWMAAGARKGPRSLQDPGVAEVRVFHPHGIIVPSEIPKEVSRPQQPSREKELIWDLVLGRNDYNELYDDLSDRRNLWQLCAFTQLYCLFYGFSFQDPNVDRLLQMAAYTLAAGRAPASSSIWGHFRHVGLLISNDSERWPTEDVKLDRYEKRRLVKSNVTLIGRAGYKQHNRFLLELLERLEV